MSFLRLFGKLSLDGSGFEKTLAKSENQAKGFAGRLERSFKQLGASFVAAFAFDKVLSGMKRLTDYVDSILNVSDTFNIDTSLLQNLANAFERGGGGGLGGVQSALEKALEQITSARGGSKEALNALRALGLDPGLKANLSPVDVILAASGAIGSAPGSLSATRREAISKLLGAKSIASLAEFNTGPDLAITRGNLLRLDRLGDENTLLRQRSLATAGNAGGALLTLSENRDFRTRTLFGGLGGGVGFSSFEQAVSKGAEDGVRKALEKASDRP